MEFPKKIMMSQLISVNPSRQPRGTAYLSDGATATNELLEELIPHAEILIVPHVRTPDMPLSVRIISHKDSL